MTLDLRSLKAMAAILPEPCLLVRVEGTICFANRAATELLNTNVENICTQRLFDLFEGDKDHVSRWLGKCARVTEPLYFGTRRQQGHGPPLAVRCEGTRVPGIDNGDAVILLRLRKRDAVGESFMVLNQKLEATQRKLQYEHTINAQLAARDTDKNLYFAKLGHELRSPLNAIVGFATMIRDMLVADGRLDKISEYADHIEQAGSHLGRVVTQLMEIGRLESGSYPLEKEELCVAPLVHDAALIAGTDVEGHIDPRLVINVPKHLPRIEADRSALSQIVINLVGNALKFTPADGTVSVDATPTDGGGLAIAVRDTGCGVCKDDIEAIFEPFQQTVSERSHGGRRGAGLGLAICAHLVDAHHGHMSFASTPGKGTVVTVSLPGADALDSVAA